MYYLPSGTKVLEIQGLFDFFLDIDEIILSEELKLGYKAAHLVSSLED